MLNYPKITLIWYILLFSLSAAGHKKDVAFDLNALQALGYSQDVADFFSEGVHFLPGNHHITLLVNANARYQLEARFNDQGRLCADPPLLRTLKLREVPLDSDCHDITLLWPGTQIKNNPGQFSVELTLPEEAFDADEMSDKYQRGGAAILLNYNLFGYQITNSNHSLQLYQGDITPGININNWVFRSRGVFSYQTGTSQYRYEEIYGLRPVASVGGVLQLGQFTLAGTVFNGLPIEGVQLYSDEAQQATTPLLIPIQGVANTQATVEIRQRGRVIYRTVVAPGPFSFSQINAIDAGTEIEVDIIEEDGQRRHMTVVNTQTEGETTNAETYQLGIGHYGATGQADESSPLFAAGELTFNTENLRRMTVASLLAADYQQLVVNHYPFEWLSTALSYMNTRTGKRAVQVDGRWQTSLDDNISGALSALYRTRDYLTADEALSDPAAMKRDYHGLRQAISATTTWSYAKEIALSYFLSYESDYRSGGGRLSQILSSHHQIGKITINLSLQHRACGELSSYLNFSMPLGKGSLSQRVQFSSGNMSLGSTYQGVIGESQRYTATITRSRQQQRFSGSTSRQLAYTQFSAGFSYADDRSHSLSLATSGSMAYSDGLFALSSSAIGDTFALLKVGEHADVSVHSSGGGAELTNRAGMVILPSITPYQEISARIDTTTLPLQSRLDTTMVDFALARGTVAIRRVGITEMKQLLLTVRLADGQFVPMGSAILDEHNHFLSTVLDDGHIMLTNNTIGKKLTARLSDQKTCQIHYQVPAYFDPAALYEVAESTCH